MLDLTLQWKAKKYVHEHAKELVFKFANLEEFKPDENPITIFMAGSPGAGKTEFSTSFKPALFDYQTESKAVMIDPDKIKLEIPQYTGKNTDSVQLAATIIADKIYDQVLKKKQCVIVDTTFARLDKASKNVERAMKHDRSVGIIYIYQDPVIAWKFTKIREIEEGRPIPKDMFIRSLFAAQENVNLVKEKYGQAIKVFLVEKDFVINKAKITVNVDKIGNYVINKYTSEDLEKILKV